MKPPLHDRDYAVCIMPNQLKVILCLDPTSKEGGALMDVHARACSDPNPKTDMVVLFHET